ncbi:helix-turn-helix DNA binding domain protein [Gordonia phage ObLaDi]|uniref:Helix-turn-helix DNA binding domain protein n=1 Tax=Gordonia phage ObLaDi TaxID=2978487 RepID=A0A977PQ46_9CAUD|nr:helix-turn-helix DNA binding domain protein [Gordonia phage ObLaDi]
MPDHLICSGPDCHVGVKNRNQYCRWHQRDPHARLDAPIPLHLIRDDLIREEWEHLRGFGMKDEHIRERLGVPASTLYHWVVRQESA